MEMVIMRVAKIIGLCMVLGAVPGAVSLAEQAHPGRAPGAGVRSMDVCSDRGRLHQLYGPTDAPGGVLVHRSSSDDGRTWSDPVPVAPAGPPPHGLRRGMDAQVAARGDLVFAAWMTPGTDRWGGGPIGTAVSTDGGAHWRPGPNPSDDGSTAGHGFLDAAFDGNGALHLVWLDSRDGSQGLRGAVSRDGGQTWEANQTLKAASCECCANTLAAGPGADMAALYRDRKPRDMGVVGYCGGKWGTAEKAAPLGWELEGCPHSGGGLAFSTGQGMGGEDGVWRLHAVVWNGHPDSAGVYRVSRRWGPDQPWGKPVQMGGAGAVHPDLASSGRFLMAVWCEQQGAELRGAFSRNGGLDWSDWTPPGPPRRGVDHPRVVPGREGFCVFWTGSEAGEKIGSLRVPWE